MNGVRLTQPRVIIIAVIVVAVLVVLRPHLHYARRHLRCVTSDGRDYSPYMNCGSGEKQYESSAHYELLFGDNDGED
jgi:hypothetical protein